MRVTTETERAKLVRDGIELDPFSDGVTHLNIYSGANTRVGREMSNMSSFPTTHPRHGYFKSVEGFWWWLSTGMKEEYFRTCNGFEARKVGVKLPKVTHTAFKHEVRYAIALKLYEHPEVLQRFLASTLPLTHYYVYGKNTPNPMVRPADRSMWVIEFLEEIRSSGGEKINKILT